VSAAADRSGDGPGTYLIAGATGVIGRRLAAALLADGLAVRALVRDLDRGRRILGSEVELFEAASAPTGAALPTSTAATTPPPRCGAGARHSPTSGRR
jgi:NAD(P)-dependent dehydrogenase (short-subunit alcohol dehydrogenase family)